MDDHPAGRSVPAGLHLPYPVTQLSDAFLAANQSLLERSKTATRNAIGLRTSWTLISGTWEDTHDAIDGGSWESSRSTVRASSSIAIA